MPQMVVPTPNATLGVTACFPRYIVISVYMEMRIVCRKPDGPGKRENDDEKRNDEPLHVVLL
jgi:hypothetical protein